MDSVLALGGAHLCYTMEGADMKSASSTHYTLAVRQLKHELTRVNSGEESDPVRLLLTILLLSTTESISANSQGVIFHHLRASSHFIPSLLALDPNHGDQEIRAFLIETYAYMVSVANITVNTQPTYPALILDPCITGLERFQDCKASGMMFGYARNLLTLLPSICMLGYNRTLEENAGKYSFENIAWYKALQFKIESWQEPSTSEDSGNDIKDLVVASKVYKEAILIFLHTAFYGSKVGDPELLSLIDTSLSKTSSFFGFGTDSPVLSVMLWPCMIIGSCLRESVARQYLRGKMLETRFNMTLVLRSVQLLDWLWEDNALDAYGPYGLGIVMRKHGIMHSMS
ncbi:hypothetical protein G7Y89_g6048 [Cudoniella acicularis]|uniref:Uncharacterized protein n=1 Tax=Cudoniella acicularis TaxID=354080 RepID=A0A8H4RM27_9HELO|nr:hypothetical protein G7Y89_g6048 [Cudoniella acicularis]